MRQKQQQQQKTTGRELYEVIWVPVEVLRIITTLAGGGATVAMAILRSLITNLLFQMQQNQSWRVMVMGTALDNRHSLQAHALPREQRSTGERRPHQFLRDTIWMMAQTMNALH
jgi:hypothetical protein